MFCRKTMTFFITLVCLCFLDALDESCDDVYICDQCQFICHVVPQGISVLELAVQHSLFDEKDSRNILKTVKNFCNETTFKSKRKNSSMYVFSEVKKYNDTGDFLSILNDVPRLQNSLIILMCLGLCVTHTIMPCLLVWIESGDFLKYVSIQRYLRKQKWLANNVHGKKSRFKTSPLVQPVPEIGQISALLCVPPSVKENHFVLQDAESFPRSFSPSTIHAGVEPANVQAKIKKTDVPFWKDLHGSITDVLLLCPAAHENMSNEALRLSTFKTAKFPVSFILLARAGFFFVEEKNTTKCFSCQVEYDAWREGDIPMVVHKELSSACYYITLLDGSLNNPGSRSTANSLSFTDTPQLPPDSSASMSEQSSSLITNVPSASGMPAVSNRSDYRGHTSYVSKDSGISSGLSNSPRDHTDSLSLPADSRRNFSHVEQNLSSVPSVVANTNSTDVSVSTPARKTQGPRSLGPPIKDRISANTQIDWENIRVPDQPSSKIPNAAKNFHDLGIVVRKPAKPQYAVLQTRLATFACWPPDKAQKPLELAECGFYYTGREDAVRCFFCNAGLKNWRPGDHPWIEHCKYFPTCGYMMQSKGHEFIKDAKNDPQKLIEMYYRDHSGEDESDGGENEEKDEMKRLMETPAAQSLKDLKYDEHTIQSAIEQFKNETGRTNFHAADLMKIILDGVDELPLEASGFNGQAEPMSVDLPDSSLSRDLRQAMEENKSLKEILMCKVCLERKSSIIFLPCGHLVTCTVCAHALKNCPICRENVKGLARAIID